MKGRILLLLCLAMLAVCLPASAMMDPYVGQAEDILPATDPGSTFDGAAWTQLQKSAGVDSLVQRFNIDDSAALGGKALKVIDNQTAAGTGVLYIKQKTGDFGGAPNVATAVVRVKVSDEAAFLTGTPWPRNILLGLGKSGQKRGVGLGILPNAIVVNNANGNTIYPQNGGAQVEGINIIPCDNTQYATYTIVGRNPVSGNASFDIYRNGVKILSGADVNSTPEAPVNGVDCLAIGSMGGAAATGAWVFDKVAYRQGEHPYWDPVTGSSITGRMVDLDGNPIGGVTFKIGDSITTSAEDGTFTLDGIAKGTWQFMASKDGFYKRLRKITVEHNTPLDLGDVKLAPFVVGAVAADTFSRADNTNPGSTEMVNGATATYPWNGGFSIAGGWTEGGTNNGYMFQAGYIAPWGATGWGSSIGTGDFNHADFEATFTTLGLDNAVAGHWGGLIYRSDLPYIYSDGGANRSYLLHWRSDGSVAIHDAWHGVNIADVPAKTGHTWAVPHQFRVVVSGPYHTVWFDGEKIIDAVDYTRVTGGYIGLVRAQADIKVDDVTVKQLVQQMGTISGKVMAAGTSTGIPGARVKASTGQMATADANGNYTLSVPVILPVNLTAVGDGYYPGSVNDVEAIGGTNVTTADIYLNAPPTPDPDLDVITDTFSRSPMVGLGYTEGANSYPWVYGLRENFAFVNDKLEMLPPSADANKWSGVSVGGGFMPADLDMSVDLTVEGTDWGGVIYRQSLPGIYDVYNGQAAANAGYLVFCSPYDNKVYLWRSGVVASADTGITNWTTPHRLRVMAIGPHHQVWIGNADGTNMVRLIDAIDTGKLTGGYTGLERASTYVTFDNLVITRYTNDNGTISGTVTDAISGSPIAGAQVTLSNGKVATADGSGNYMFNRLPDGNFTVTATAEGYYYAQVTAAVAGQGDATAPVLALQPLPATPDATVIDSFDRADSLNLGYTETTNGAIKVPWSKPAEADDTTEIASGWMKMKPNATGFGPGLGHQFQPADIDMSVMFMFGAADGAQWAGLAYRQALIASHNQIDEARLSPKQTAADRGYLVYARQDGSGIDLWRDGVVLASAKISSSNRIDWTAPRYLRVRAMGVHHEVFVGFEGAWEKVIDYYDFNGKTSGGFIGIMRAGVDLFADDFKCYAYRGPLCQITGTVTDAAAPNGPVANAQIRFADGTIATTDANGVYSTSVGSATGVTSLIAVANTYRKKILNNINVTPGGTTTYDFTLGKLPNKETLYYAQVPGPRYDTFSRPDCGGNTLDASFLGKTEDGNWSRGDATHAPEQGGLGFSWEGLSDSVRSRTQIKDGKFVLPYCAPTELLRGMGMAGLVGSSFPIDGDFTFIGEAGQMTDPGDYIGTAYRFWGGWQFHGYAMQCFADGKAQLVYNHGNQAWSGGGNNPYQPTVVATYQFPTVPDWTKPHKFRVRFEGPRHQAWVDDQMLWDVQDWGWMEYGYIGPIHQNAEFRTDDWWLAFDSWLPIVPDGGQDCPTVADAKSKADGSFVKTTGAPVVTGVFNGFFYIEDSSRASGIKVVSNTSVSIGDAVTVSGSMKTANGEKYIQATSVSVDSHPGELKALGMTNKSNAPAAGLSNVGLLTKVWGKVISPDTPDTYCVVDDGSGTYVKVLIAGTTKPAYGKTISCTGISSIDTDGTPVIRMRSNADLTIN